VTAPPSDGYVFVPITLKEANAFVARYHRHNKPTVGHKFSIGLALNGDLVGVGIAGRPVARHLDDGRTLEATRVCVKPGHQNACSKVYARLKRIGQLFGYTSIKTYTLLEETGSSLRAIRAIPERRCPPSRWNRPGACYQPVYDKEKTRWELLRSDEKPPNQE
jgi:hypothetical protein